MKSSLFLTIIGLTLFMGSLVQQDAEGQALQRCELIPEPGLRAAGINRPHYSVPFPPGVDCSSRNSENISVVGRWAYGPSFGADAMGSVAYFGNGNYLDIVDFSDPDRPARLSQVLLPDLVWDVTVEGGYAYVACYDLGLRIVDLFGPTVPYEVGFLDTQFQVYEIAVDGSLVFLANSSDGLRIIDCSDPSNPSQIGWLNLVGISRGVALKGDIAFIAAGAHGLKAIDVSDPTAPFQIGNFQPGGGWYAQHVALMGSYALVAGGSSGLRILDVSDPTALVQVSELDTPGYAWRLAVRDTRVYLADSEGGFRVISVFDPTAPMELGVLATSDPTENVALGDDLAFVPAGSGGLVVVGIGGMPPPVQVGHFPTAGRIYHMAVEGRYAYAAGDGLAVIDVSDPGSPILVAQTDIVEDAWGVALEGDHFFVAEDEAGLRIVDVSDPGNPLEIGLCDTPGYATQVALNGSYAYVADDEAGLRVIDVSDPTAPYEVGVGVIPDRAHAVCIQNEFAFVAGHRFNVFDITDPVNPLLVGYLPGYDCEMDLDLAGDFAYVVSISGHMRVIDISIPSSPVQISSLATGPGVEISVVDGLAYIASLSNALQVIDISDHANLTECGFFESSARGVTVNQGNVYLSAGPEGFWILRYDAVSGVPPTLPMQPSLRLAVNPNPFNPQTTITFEIPAPGHTKLRIFDLQGRLITTLVEEISPAGHREVRWNGRDAEGREVPSGIYLSRLEAGGQVAYGRMTLVR
jgi:hypothetical protein